MRIKIVDQRVRDAISRYIEAHGNLSQAAFARSVDVSEQTVGRWLAGKQDYAVRKAGAQVNLWEKLEPYLDAEYRRILQPLGSNDDGLFVEQSLSALAGESKALSEELRIELREMLDDAVDSLTTVEQMRIFNIFRQAIRRKYSR